MVYPHEGRPCVLTKMRITSLSFCQRCIVFWSSASTVAEYMEKSGPQLSSKSGSPENGWFSTDRGEYRWPYSTHSGEINWKRSEWRVPVAHHHFDSPFQHLESALEKVRVTKSNRDERLRGSKGFLGGPFPYRVLKYQILEENPPHLTLLI